MPLFMKFPKIAVIFLSCLMAIFTWLSAPSAIALTQIKLSDLSYHECSAEVGKGLVSSGDILPMNCFIITGKAENTSGKPVHNADIYGRIFDANGDPIAQNRGRIGAIDEVPPGISDFEFRISVSASQPTPLSLEKFKAAGFTGTVRR